MSWVLLYRLKNYAQRSSNYLQIVNIVLLVYIAFRNSWHLNLLILAPITGLFVLIGLFIIGYFDHKLGFLAADVEYHDANNPLMRDVVTRLERIEAKIKGERWNK